MRYRSLTYGLAVVVLATVAGEARSQEICCGNRRSETLIDLFQHRIFGSSGDCGCGIKSSQDACFQKPAPVQKEAPDQKAAPVQKPTIVQKAIPVQKVPCLVETPSVQKTVSAPPIPCVQEETCRPRPVCVQLAVCEQSSTSCQKTMFPGKGGDIPCGCEPCGYCRTNTIADMVQRLDGALLRIFPAPVCSASKKDGKGDDKAEAFVRREKGCGCDGPIIEGDLPTTVPEVPKPRFESNPFQDDTLQPAPLPSAPSREARRLQQTPANRTAASSETGQPVRAASHFFEPIHVE